MTVGETDLAVLAGRASAQALALSARGDRLFRYGSGKDVSEETVADAGEPLRLRLLGGSSIEIPIAR